MNSAFAGCSYEAGTTRVAKISTEVGFAPVISVSPTRRGLGPLELAAEAVPADRHRPSLPKICTMPLVRIILTKGRPADELRAVADSVHAALVETYAVPPDDRFQIIEQREPGEIIYSPTYLGIERTNALVIIHVVAGHWRDTTAKQALYRALADKLSVDPGIRREDVQVVITSNDKPDWSFGNGIASYIDGASKTNQGDRPC